MLGDLRNGSVSGVAKKCRSQIAAINDLGHVCDSYLGILNEEKPNCRELNYVDLSSVSKFERKSKFFEHILKNISQKHYDIVYIRYPLASLSFHFFVKKLSVLYPQVKILLERQTIEPNELRLISGLSGKLKYYSEILLRKRIQRYVYANVCVTSEISDYITSYIKDSKNIVMGNGIDTDTYRIYQPLDFYRNDIRLVFIGNLSYWTGLEQLITNLEKKNFKHNGKSIFLDIIGDGVCYSKLQERFSCSYVKFHGFLKDHQSIPIMLQSDVAIGSLGAGQRGLTEGSNLKLRQYCLLGLPFVKADLDFDFDNIPECSEFFLNISSDITQGEIDKLISFSELVKSNPELRMKMKNYGAKYLSWKYKFQKLLQVLGV